MKFYSTNNCNHAVSLSEAVFMGLHQTKAYTCLKEFLFSQTRFSVPFTKRSFQEIAFEVAKVLIEEDISNDELIKIVKHTVCF